ncbi:unnamed protein product [Brachionus calyciflorus]|uniref:RNA-directed DNA polymerase from mobile element jockey-like n=1 Tax=Brachionus calyciflorus TaxID=104777 RepID=A0A813M921_9BILA|nr:unnamed protein product [Brachionus calyciflorus]
MSTTELNDIPSAKATVALLDSWVIKLFNRVVDLENMVNDMKAEVDELKKTVADKDEEIKKIKESSTTNTCSYAAMLKGTKNTEAENVLLAKISKENKEKRRKENNIIISGLPEKNDGNVEEKKEYDNEKVNKILNILELDSEHEIKKYTRLKPSNPNKKSDMIVVELNSKKKVTTALKNSKELKNNEEFKNVYINRDLSLAERNREEVRGGGVVIFIRNDLVAHEVTSLINNDPRSEQVWCMINIDSDSIPIGCIYRPPFGSRESNLAINKSTTKAKSLVENKFCKSLLIAGDFNYSDII